ncbi:MAG: DUF4890 domain-containing protein [Prevotellaceae bacterium]|jgi:hypothetical protein|nr:DUF4890 domain-containing protein [Prevotellaceae bacterium]
MKTMITLCTVAALLLCAPAWAQPGNTPEQRAKKLTRQMNKTLDLDKTQKKKVAEINLTYIQKQDEITQRQDDGATNQAQLHYDLLQLVAERNSELKEVLSVSQYGTYMEYESGTRKSMQQEERKRREAAKKK